MGTKDEEEEERTRTKERRSKEGNIQLSSTTNIHPSPLSLYFCIVLGIVSSSPPISFALLISPPSSFTAVIRVFSEILLRWPLYFNHAPAAEMWSVVLNVSTSERERGGGSESESRDSEDMGLWECRS